MNTLITILAIIMITTNQPIANVETTETGTLITYIDGTGYYQEFTD